MPQLPEVVVDVLERADRSLMAGWYDSVSVSADRVRAWLRARSLAFVDPSDPAPPPLSEVDRTADLVVARSANLMGALGGAAGLVGAATVPPEWLATNVAALRMAQRLCVVYGFDPAEDRGQMALVRALAAAYGVDLPESGPLRMRVSEIPTLFRRGSPGQYSAKLARAMATSSMWWVVGRITRFVPILSASRHAYDAKRQVHTAGAKMAEVLRRMTEAPELTVGELEEAREV